MCGIAGLWTNRIGEVGAATRRMIAALKHRGPDGDGFWEEGSIALAHRRLAIRDLTSAGAQPFCARNGQVVVVYNGEIYNHRELAARLERESGFVPRTHCDTELIPEAYLVWGTDAFDRLEGMFAIALWDRAAQRLVLARDGVGIKPLYYWETTGEIGFASEIKGALAAWPERRRLAPGDIAHMLALGYPAPDRTLIEGLLQLPPGTVLARDGRGTRMERFWRPSRRPRDISADAALAKFNQIFPAIVKDQLVSDVPLGVMQSGGIDSSLISLSLPQGGDIPLFTVRFAERSHDESAEAAELARLARRSIVWVDLQGGETLEQDFRATVAAVDGHLADSSLLAVFMLSRALAGHTRVALSGDGADEFFGGYQTYAASALAERARHALAGRTWWRMAERLERTVGRTDGRISRREKAVRFLTGLGHVEPHTAWRIYLPPWKRKALFGPALADMVDDDPLAGYAAAMAGDGDLVDRCLLADQSYYLPADMLVKLDRASMAHGLEVRVPFLDRRIMDFAGSLPPDLLVKGSSGTKLILRQALAARGAPKSISGGRKRGFNIPMNAVLSTTLKALADRLLLKNADIFAPILSPDGVRRLWRSHSEGRTDEKYPVWTLLTMGTWLETVGGA